MNKYFFILIISLFSFQSVYSNVIIKPYNKTSIEQKQTEKQPAKDTKTCLNMWKADSKGKDNVKFMIGGFEGLIKYNKNGYLIACKEGTLPALKPTK